MVDIEGFDRIFVPSDVVGSTVGGLRRVLWVSLDGRIVVEDITYERLVGGLSKCVDASTGERMKKEEERR